MYWRIGCVADSGAAPVQRRVAIAFHHRIGRLAAVIHQQPTGSLVVAGICLVLVGICLASAATMPILFSCFLSLSLPLSLSLVLLPSSGVLLFGQTVNSKIERERPRRSSQSKQFERTEQGEEKRGLPHHRSINNVNLALFARCARSLDLKVQI